MAVCFCCTLVVSDSSFLAAVSCEYLCLVVIGLPRPGCGPFPSMRAFLAASVFNSCCKNELSDLDYCPPDGPRRSPHKEAGNGSKTVMWAVSLFFLSPFWCKYTFPVCSLQQNLLCEIRVTLYCCQAFNMYYYKYTIQGINIFALSILLSCSENL